MNRETLIAGKLFNLLNSIKDKGNDALQEVKLFAQDNLSFRHIICESILNKLEISKGLSKMNCYYAIDIILKQVGQPYISLLEPVLLARFPVDLASLQETPELRSKLLILFLSWEGLLSTNTLKKIVGDFYFQHSGEDLYPTLSQENIAALRAFYRSRGLKGEILESMKKYSEQKARLAMENVARQVKAREIAQLSLNNSIPNPSSYRIKKRELVSRVVLLRTYLSRLVRLKM